MIFFVFFKKLSKTDFGIGDIVVDTTPVTTLREQSYCIHRVPDEDPAPFERTHKD